MQHLIFEDLKPDLLGNRETVRANTKRDKEAYQIPLEKVFVMKDFNGRTVFTGIDELAESILKNGQENPGTVIVLNNGTFAITKGERRFRALKLLEEKGHGKQVFKAFLSERNVTLDELYFSELSTQHVSHLLPQEIGGMLQKLLSMNYTQGQIAAKIGRSPKYVSDMIAFCREDKEVKDLVTDGKITVTTVMKARKEIKNKAERTEVIKAAAQSGKKVTARDVTKEDPRENKILKITAGIFSLAEFSEDIKQKIENILRNNL